MIKRFQEAKCLSLSSQTTGNFTIMWSDNDLLVYSQDWGSFSFKWPESAVTLPNVLKNCEPFEVVEKLAEEYNRWRNPHDKLAGKREEILEFVISVFIESLRKGELTTHKLIMQQPSIEQLDKINAFFSDIGKPFIKVGENHIDKIVELATEMVMISKPKQKRVGGNTLERNNERKAFLMLHWEECVKIFGEAPQKVLFKPNINEDHKKIVNKARVELFYSPVTSDTQIFFSIKNGFRKMLPNKYDI